MHNTQDVKMWSHVGSIQKTRCCKYYLNQNTLGVKSSSQELKKTRMKKMWNQIEWLRSPAVDEIKILIMMTRPQNILFLLECFATLSSLSKVLISSTLTSGGLGHLIWFHIFSSWSFFSSWPLFFYTRGTIFGKRDHCFRVDTMSYYKVS